MYDETFFALIRDGIQRSAAIVVPIVTAALEEAQPERTLIDVGCGEGWWGAEFAAAGFAAEGIDANQQHTAITVRDHDLERPLPADTDRYGVALCLEVAEHLTPGRAPSFIAELCALSDIVVFSAAIPGQGGTGHLNEQWPTYWVDLFTDHGFACSGALRWQIWTDDRVENWYRQNLIVATLHPDRLPALFDSPLAPVWPVVHPVLYDARRAR